MAHQRRAARRLCWHRLRAAASAALLLSLPACTDTPPPALADISPAQQAEVARVQIIGAGDARAARLRPVGSVKGYACNTNEAASDTTLRQAIEQAKYRAFLSGADAIADFSCAAVSAQSWLCEQCNGTASLRTGG